MEYPQHWREVPDYMAQYSDELQAQQEAEEPEQMLLRCMSEDVIYEMYRPVFIPPAITA